MFLRTDVPLPRLRERLLVCIAVVLFASIGFAQSNWQTTSKEVVEGANALKKAARFPWYDQANDDIRSVVLPKSKEPLQPSNWEAKPKSKASKNWNFDGLWKLLEVLAWIVLAVIFVVLASIILRSLGFSMNQSSEIADEEDPKLEEERIAQLPFPVKKTMGNLLAEARRYYEQGDYAKAIVFLFSHELVQLDKSQYIHLTRGKTNRQYMHELTNAPRIKSILSNTMLVFEDVFFGGYALGKERFDSCWNQLDEFHGLAKKGTS